MWHLNSVRGRGMLKRKTPDIESSSRSRGLAGLVTVLHEWDGEWVEDVHCGT